VMRDNEENAETNEYLYLLWTASEEQLRSTLARHKDLLANGS